MPKKLTQKQKLERLEWLEKWVNSHANNIKNWLDGLEPITKEKMDYSPKSLVILGEYLSSLDHESDLNTSFDTIVYYYGKTILKSMPYKMIWDIKTDEFIAKANEDLTGFVYTLEEKPFLTNITLEEKSAPNVPKFNLYNAILRAIYQSNKNELFNTYQSYLKSYNKSQNTLTEQKNSTFNQNSYNYQYYLLLKTSENFLPVIAKRLENYLKTRKDNIEVSFHDDNHLLVKMDKDYYFHFWFDNSDDTQSEIKEIAQNYDGAKDKNLLSSCQSRIEFWGDEDQDMNFFNDSLFLLEQLENSPEIVAIIDVKTGEEL